MTQTSNTVTFTVQAAGASALESAINALTSAGQFSSSPFASWSAATWTKPVKPGSSQNGVSLSFTNTGIHDQTRGLLVHLGACYSYTNLVIYTISSDTWGFYGPSGSVDVHSWDHLAYDETNGILYWGDEPGNVNQRSLSILTPSAAPTALPSMGFAGDTYGYEFWPSLNSIMAYDRSENGGGIYRRVIGAANATLFAQRSTPLNVGPHPFMVHNPITDRMYLGGGQYLANLWELTTAGVLTQLATPPAVIDGVRQHAVCSEHTGDLYLIDCSGGQTRKFVRGADAGTGTWSTLAHSYPALVTSGQGANPNGCVIPLRGYGVDCCMIITSAANNGATVYAHLYRYGSDSVAYSSAFNATENPISDGGQWVNGGATGIAWKNIRTTGGIVCGSAFQSESPVYDDCIACLSESFNANQYAEGVVYKASGYLPSRGHEIELLLRFQITGNNARGYEILWNANPNFEVVKWNGPAASWTPLSYSGTSPGTPQSGDVLRAEITGTNPTTITIKKNGTTLGTATDSSSPWTSGSPGVGTYCRVAGDAVLTSIGWASFSAGNL